MAKKSKKMQEALKKVDATKAYSVEEAVALAKDTNIAKFDATVERSICKQLQLLRQIER